MNDAIFRPSSMLRRQRCPGSLALESTLPAKVGDEPNEYAAEGAMLHRLIADPSLPRDGLKPSQLELLDIVEKAESQFIKTILGGSKDCIRTTEKTFVFVRGDKVLFSGTPDTVLVFSQPSCAIILERKFGYKVVQPADGNLQLRSYITMVADVFPSERYFGVLTQPRISSKPLIVEYTPADIVKARAEIETIFDVCQVPYAPRMASEDGCSFCRAQQVCHEFRSWVGAVERARHLPVAAWSDEELDIFESRRGILEKWLKETHEQIRQLKASQPERLPGWRLKDGANVRTISDLISAWSALKPLLVQGFGDEAKAGQQFSNCCDISIGALEDLIYDMKKNGPGKISQKDTKRLLNSLLVGLIELRQNKPSLVKEKE